MDATIDLIAELRKSADVFDASDLPAMGTLARLAADRIFALEHEVGSLRDDLKGLRAAYKLVCEELPGRDTGAAYDLGFKNGLECFAYWKDGSQYVGTNGTRLDEAVHMRHELHNFRPPRRKR